MLAMALMAFAGAGCVEPLRPEDKQGGREGLLLPIQVNLPTRGYATKAISDGPVEGINGESDLRSLQVWAFSHPVKPESAMTEEEKSLFLNEGAITYLDIPDLNALQRVDPSGSVEVNMVIPDFILKRADENLKLDFYALGNGASLNWGSAGSFTRKQLREAEFEGVYFGTDPLRPNFVKSNDPFPAEGLPMACFFDNRGSGYDISFLKTDPTPTPARMEEMGRVWPEMDLSRSVARMRFLFCQATGMSETRIDSIKLYDFDNELDAGIIPTESYIFPRESAASDITLPDGVAYEPLTWIDETDWRNSLITNIMHMDDPTILCSSSEVMRGMSAQYFDNYVKALVDSGQVTQYIIYLRESDRPVRGKIYYNGKRTTGGELVVPSQTVDFDMAGLGFPDQTNFYRNHSWTVYSYAIGQHMEVDVRLDDWVVPWSRSDAIINGESTVNVDQDGKFITDATMQGDSLRYDNGTVKYKPNGKPEKKWFNVPVPAGDSVTGRIVIYAPYNGQLIVTPVPVDSAEFWPRLGPEGNADAADWFEISLTTDRIDRSVDLGSGIPGLIAITVKRNNGTPPGRKAIRLSFSVKVETQTIAADSELIDDEYHFIIDP